MENFKLGIVGGNTPITETMLEELENVNDQIKAILKSIGEDRGVNTDSERIKDFTAEEVAPIAEILQNYLGYEVTPEAVLNLFNYESPGERFERQKKQAEADGVLFSKLAQAQVKECPPDFYVDKPRTVGEKKEKKQNYRNFSRKHNF